MTPEDEHRKAHPDKLRYYDVRIDAFRDLTPKDLSRISELCFIHNVPTHVIRTQADLDRILDALAAHIHKEN